jgi:hypothetical protein
MKLAVFNGGPKNNVTRLEADQDRATDRLLHINRWRRGKPRVQGAFSWRNARHCAQVSRAGKIAAANTSYGPLGI